MAFQEFSKNYLNILTVLILEHHFIPSFPFWPAYFLYLNEALLESSGALTIFPLSPINGSSL